MTNLMMTVLYQQLFQTDNTDETEVKLTPEDFNDNN